MPLYEYECDSCGHRFEKIQKFSDALVDTCPKCQKSVHKLMSSPAIQFKGSGWYITDYAKKDSTAAGKAGGGNEKGNEKGSDKESSKDGGKDSGSSSKESSTGSTSGESSASSTTTTPAASSSTTKAA